MSDTSQAASPTLEDPVLDAPPAESFGGLDLDPDKLQECIESGRPLKELFDLDDHIWETMYEFGFRNYRNGQFPAAVYWWVHTCLFDSRRDRNWIALGMAYQQQQKYPEALSAFSLAVHHGSNNPWAPLRAAECHLHLKDAGKAARALDSAEAWLDNTHDQELIRKRIAMLRKGIRKQQERLAAAAQQAVSNPQ